MREKGARKGARKHTRKTQTLILVPLRFRYSLVPFQSKKTHRLKQSLNNRQREREREREREQNRTISQRNTKGRIRSRKVWPSGAHHTPFPSETRKDRLE